MVMLMLLSLGSCNSFLDIKPEGELIQDEQFKDVQGYRDAMYGIYASMAQGELFGMMMNWGLVDVLAQQFGDEYGLFADASEGGPLVNMLILSMPRFIIIRISGWKSR